MDYDKLTKEELISICKEKNISFSSLMEKEKIIDILIQYDLNNKNTNIKNDDSQNNKIDSVGRAGAIINILFASFGLIIWIFLSIFIIGIPFLVGGICTIVSNIRFKNGKDNKVMAGVLGIIFAGFIGGILVLISDKNN